jgi:hypothetical protein
MMYVRQRNLQLLRPALSSYKQNVIRYVYALGSGLPTKKVVRANLCFVRFRFESQRMMGCPDRFSANFVSFSRHLPEHSLLSKHLCTHHL